MTIPRFILALILGIIAGKLLGTGLVHLIM